MEPAVELAILALTGLFAGLCSGLLGVGGGFLMTPVLYWLFSAGGTGETLATRVAFGTSLAVMVPTMVSGTLGHHGKGAVDWGAAVPLAAGAVLGGLAGGTLAAHLPGSILRGIFGILVIAMAVRMAWHGGGETRQARAGSGVTYAVVGVCIGTVSGLAGIGGGVLLVPVLVTAFGFPIHVAVGTSSACLVFSSSAAVIAYIFHGLGVQGLPAGSLGYVYLPAWAVLAAVTVPLSRLGVRVAHACRPGLLRGIFAIVLVAIGLSMLCS
ncbi:MAG: sulfite exporter TauE/SafE family protein [Methanolinea sp.]|nr:sulfite exporter TauE/SafE family protein [Methanolinea sp.]